MNHETDAPDEGFLAPEDFHQYEYASTGKRFLNLLIDQITMSWGLGLLTGFLFGLILGMLAPDFIGEVANATDTGNYNGEWFLFVYGLGLFNHLVYYTFCEKVFNGRTLGKLITGTRAIRQDGQPLTLRDAMLRTLVRMVPFEPFSGFSTLTWHDRWTGTMVVRGR